MLREEDQVVGVQSLLKLGSFAQVFQAERLQVLTLDLLNGRVSPRQQVLVEVVAELLAFELSDIILIIKVRQDLLNLLVSLLLRLGVAKEQILVSCGHVTLVDQIDDLLLLARNLDRVSRRWVSLTDLGEHEEPD